MKLSRYPSALLLLCLDQPPAQAFQGRFRQLALRYIDECDDRPDHLLAPPLGIGPVFSGETCSIGSPQHLVVGVYSFASLKYLEYQAVLHRNWHPVRVSVMYQIMHVLADELINAFVSQGAKACWIAECAATVEINSIYSFSRRI